MPNEYSIEIHNFLTKLINESKTAVDKEKDSHFHYGRIKELQKIRKYLADHIDLKDFQYY